MNRRGFLQAILATGVAPYVVTSAGVLMPCRPPIARLTTDEQMAIIWEEMARSFWDPADPKRILREVMVSSGYRSWIIN